MAPAPLYLRHTATSMLRHKMGKQLFDIQSSSIGASSVAIPETESTSRPETESTSRSARRRQRTFFTGNDGTTSVHAGSRKYSAVVEVGIHLAYSAFALAMDISSAYDGTSSDNNSGRNGDTCIVDTRIGAKVITTEAMAALNVTALSLYRYCMLVLELAHAVLAVWDEKKISKQKSSGVISSTSNRAVTSCAGIRSKMEEISHEMELLQQQHDRYNARLDHSIPQRMGKLSISTRVFSLLDLVCSNTSPSGVAENFLLNFKEKNEQTKVRNIYKAQEEIVVCDGNCNGGDESDLDLAYKVVEQLQDTEAQLVKILKEISPQTLTLKKYNDRYVINSSSSFQETAKISPSSIRNLISRINNKTNLSNFTESATREKLCRGSDDISSSLSILDEQTAIPQPTSDLPIPNHHENGHSHNQSRREQRKETAILSRNLKAGPVVKQDPSTTISRRQRSNIPGSNIDQQRLRPMTNIQKKNDKSSKRTAMKPTAMKTTSKTSAKSTSTKAQNSLEETILSELLQSTTKNNTEWDDIVGLPHAKRSLQEAIVLPFLRPDLYTGLRTPPRGILLYGPPGTGKTMLARAAASEATVRTNKDGRSSGLRSFFACSASTLTSKYVGEGEKLVRALFDVARRVGPSIIFLDEIDSILSVRKSDGEHEASRRLKTEFMVQFDGVRSSDASNSGSNTTTSCPSDHVLVLACSNCPWDLDEAILRRFQRRIYVPLPDEEARHALISRMVSLNKSNMTPANMKALVRITHGYSCSDLASLGNEASFGPLRSLGGLQEIQQVKIADLRPINYNDFKTAAQNCCQSVSVALLEKYNGWEKKQSKI